MRASDGDTGDRDGPASTQILFVQGGGEDVHDDWDLQLVENLRTHLGDRYEIRYPRMPGEANPDYRRWKAVIRAEIDRLTAGAVIVGHSVGGTITARLLAERRLAKRLGGIVLIAAPFLGEGGWQFDEFAFGPDLGSRLPAGVPVHVLHGLDDEIAPPGHADRYGEMIPQAQVHRVPGRDHQFGNDMSEVAAVIRGL